MGKHKIRILGGGSSKSDKLRAATGMILKYSEHMEAQLDLVKLNNEKFSAMTPGQKRVAIAKDVLLQLKSRKYIATSGLYVKLDIDVDDNIIEKKTDLRSVIRKTRSCDVCAVGSVFMSALRVFDALKILPENEKDVSVSEAVEASMRPYLTLFFPLKMQDDMESCFESNYCRGITFIETKGWDDEILPQDRLEKIMRILIAQKGNFDPVKYNRAEAKKQKKQVLT